MNDLERALYIKLVVHLVRYFPQRDHGDGEGVVCRHDYMSAFENVCSVLEDLGFAEGFWPAWWAEPEDPKIGYMQPPVYRLRVKPDSARQALERSIPSDAPDLSEVLSTWLSIVSGFMPGDQECLPTTRESFSCPDAVLDAMSPLERLGYVERRGDKFSWTIRIAPQMRAAALWSEENQDHFHVMKQEVEPDSKEFLRRLPPHLRETALSHPRVITMTHFLWDRWRVKKREQQNNTSKSFNEEEYLDWVAFVLKGKIDEARES